MDADNYLGFGMNACGETLRFFGESFECPTRAEAVAVEALSSDERLAITQDTSPAVYHWNNLVHVGSRGDIGLIYARGKDFIPFSALEYVEQIRGRLADKSLGPGSLQIQPFQTCNDDCSFCCTADYRKLPIYRGKRLSRDEWFALIDHHADGGGKVIEIIGGGEPTLHPDFVDVLRHMAHRGIKAYLFTNGTRFAHDDGRLNEPLLNALAECCVFLTVSLDGYRNRHLVHRKIPFEKTLATFRAMEHIHALRDPRKMAFYNSFIVTGGPNQESNLGDLYECVARQAGWVDSIHVQNDFVSLSHLNFDFEYAHKELQRTLDDHFRDTYIYYNYPLISSFGLRVPYSLSTHNRPSSEFSYCPRALLAPTIECGSNKLWPCGKYAGEAKASDQQTFASIRSQFRQMRNSPDFKNQLVCEPCINSSYNQSLLEVARTLERDPNGTFYHFYDRRIVDSTINWPHGFTFTGQLDETQPHATYALSF